MRNSFEFKECERFLKRVLKDRGMFTKGAVIAFLITGGIGFLGGHTVEAAQAGVIGNPHSGGTTIDYHWAGSDLLTHESIVFAPVTDDNVGTTAERFQGIYNRQAYNSVIIGGHAWAAGSTLSKSYITNPGTYRPAQQTVIGNNATGIGGQATAVGSGTFAMDQATAVGNDVMAIGASSIAIGNDDISEKYKDTMTDKVIKSIYGNGDSKDENEQGIFRSVEFIDSKGTKRKRTSLDPSGYDTLRSWNWFKSSYMTDNSSSAGGEDTHIYSPTMSRGIGSIAIGSRSIAKSDGATAIGTLAFALGEGSTAMGLRSYTGEDATGAVAIGEESRSFAAQSLAVGNHNESSEQGSMSYGYSAKAAGIGSLAIGYRTYANTEFGTNAGAAALISGVHDVNGSLTSAQQTAWDNFVAKSDAYYAEVKKYPKNPDEQGSVIVAKKAMETAYNQLTATGFSVDDVSTLTYVSDGQAGKNNEGPAVVDKISKLKKVAEAEGETDPEEKKIKMIDTKKENGVYLTTTDKDGKPKTVQKTVKKGDNSIAIGYYAVATANSSIAQGAGTVAEGASSIAMGSLASTTDKASNSIAVGVASTVTKENSVAIGTQSTVHGAGAVALGAGSRVYGLNSMAMGYGSTVLDANSTAIGVGSEIKLGSANSQAIGTNAKIDKNSGNSIALGNSSKIGSDSVNTIAQGFGTTIGNNAYNSMALGAYASIGDKAKSSFAMGTASRVDADARSSMALGEGSYVNKDQSIALGRNARAEFANSVALGFQSTTHYYGNPTTREASLSTTETATNMHGLNVGAYLPEGSKLAGKLAKLDAMAAGYVSVGGWTEEVSTTENGVTKKENVLGLRRIVNVAPGALDTDAVTVAQLRDWTDKTAHFLSISGASGKSSTNFAAESWAIDGKDRRGYTLGTLSIKGNFENEGASTVDRALAVGAYANALGNQSVAIADHAVAKGNQAISMGQNSFTLGENSTAVGSYATAFADNAIAMGVDSLVGEVTRDSNKRITAVGRSNQASIAMGFGAQVNADNAVALGMSAKVLPKIVTDTAGTKTYTEANSSVAIGQNAQVVGAQHSLALGENSAVATEDTTDTTAAAFTGEAATNYGNGVISIGNTRDGKNVKRRIINVAGGSGEYDAVNVKQLKKATAYYSVNSNESADKAVNGIASVKSNVNNDGAIGRYSVAIGSYANANKESGVALGREVVTQGEKGVGLGYAVVSRGDEAVAIGSVARAYGANSIALGKSAQVGTATTESDGTVTYGEVPHAIAIGNSAKVEAGQGSMAIGWLSKVTEDDVKYSPTVAGATVANPYVLSDNEDQMNDKGNGVVSFGTKRITGGSGFARRLTGIAGGYNDYDAVNVKQLKKVKTDLEAAQWGLAVNPGTGTTTDVTPDATTKKVTLKAGNNISLTNSNGVVTVSSKTPGYMSINSSFTTDKAYTGVADTVKSNVNNDGAEGAGSIAIGPAARARQSSSLAVGYNAIADTNNSIALGLNTRAMNQNAIAMGSQSVVQADNSIAFGVDSKIGTNVVNSRKQGDEIAIGRSSQAQAEGAIAMGYNAQALHLRSVAIGYGSNSAAEHSVALGEASKTYESDNTNGTAYLTTESVNNSGNGVISVGTKRSDTNDTNTVVRRIVGVAGGYQDYDAVNVKQLKALETNERHIKAQTGNNAYTPDASGNVTLNYVNGRGEDVNDTTVIKDVAKKSDEWKLAVQSGNATTGTAVVPKGSTTKQVTLKEGTNITLATDTATGTVTISAAGGITSVRSGNTKALTVSTTSGAVTVTPVLAGAVSTAGDANKLVTAGVVNTAIAPLATRSLNNITDDGKKVITGLGTIVTAGDRVSLATTTDTTTGQKTYTLSADNQVESVEKAAAASGDENIATVNVKTGGTAGAANATYQVGVSKSKVAEIAQTAVTVASDSANVTVTPDTTTAGVKKYKISVAKDVFASGTNTTKAGTGTATDPYKYNLNAALTGMTSVTAGNSTTGLTLSSGGAGTAASPKTDVVISKTGVTFTNNNGTSTGTVSIGNAGINAGNLVISNVKAPTADADAANKKYVDDNLMNVDVITKNGTADKTENVTNGTRRKMTLKAGDNVELSHNNGTVTITAKGGLKTVTSANDAIAATTDANGNVTLTANVGTKIDDTAANAGKLATVGAVNTAITPLANKTLDNITDDGKKVITGLGPVVAASGSNVTVAESTIDNETGTKKYTVSVTKDVFASGTNTTKSGTGTAADPYKYNLNAALTGMESIEGKGGTNTFTVKNGAAMMTFNDATTGKNAKAANITVNNINITGLQDAALTATSTDAVTGKQLYATNTNVTNLTNTVNGHTTAINTLNTTVEKAITFKGNDTQGINKKLGETLEVTGEGTYTAAPTTAAGNIYTKQNNGKLEIGLAKDLQNISSITNTKTDGSKSTKLELGDDELKVTNTQGTGSTATKTTVTIGKDGINAGGKDVTAVNEVDAKSVKANTVTVGKANSSGIANDGIDGKVTVTGKNGSAVELNGATGGLTLTTVNGTATNTISIKTKEGSGPIVGEGGAAAPTNMSRLVYTTKVNGTDTDYEVATMKDGMKYAGDDVTATDKTKVIAKKLNETVDIVGGATTTNLTTNNIGVVNDNGKLNVRLSKVITGMESITAGKTVLNTSSVTVSGAGTNTNKTTLDATGTTVTDGVTNGKTTTTTVDGLKVINNIKGAQIGAELIRINGTKGTGDTVTDGIAIGNQTVTATKNNATTEANTGNYITGLNNKDWDLDTKGYVSGRAATEDQLKVLNDKISAKSASDYRLIANPDTASGGEYTLNANGKIELKVQDASNPTSVNTITIKNVAKKDELDKLKEAKALIYVDANGNEVFKQADGTFQKADGTVVAANTVRTKVNTTGAAPITNVSSIVENTAVTGTNPDYVDKLNATVADATNGAKNKATAVNVSDLQKTAAAIIDRGITFQGNDGNDIKKGLGQTLNIVGEGNYGTPATAPNTAAGNIFTKQVVDGTNKKLEIGLASDLKNITSVSSKDNAGKSTKLELGDDDLKVINTQGAGATATTTTVTIGKDGINAGGKNVTAVNEIDAKSVKANTVTAGKANSTTTATDGVDGKVTVTGANGSGVDIKGADGSITVYGANGSNKASFKTKEVEGVLGADVKVGDAKPNMTRFVYETANPDGSTTPITHVVATMDDGMKYSGDDHEASTATAAEKNVVTRKLNERLEIVGGAKTDLTNNNIGVINNGDTGKLTVKLSKNLKEIETIANVADPTDTTKASTVMTLSNDGVTFKNTQAPTTAGGKATTSTVEIKKDGVTEFKTNDGTKDGNTVTINGKTGTIATGNTVVDTTSVTVSGTGTAKTTLDASGTTVTDGKANGKSVVTTVNGTTVTDGTHTTSTTATGITISPSAVAGKTVSLTNAGLNNGGNRITDVAAPTDDTDAANKQYVDARTKLRYKANTVEPDVPGVAKANHEINILDGVLNIEGVTDQVVTTASKDGKITVGLAPAVTKKLDQLAATTSDGRDSKLGSEANAIASTGIATADGINGQNVTYKVNALRHGEAGSVVFTDEDGNRLVKATDGKYYKATDVKPDGTVKATPAGGTAPVGLDLLNADKDKAYSSLVSPDGKTTGATSVLNNVGSALSRVLPTLDTNTDKTKFLDKLDKATEAGSKVAHAAVNVTDLKNTSDAIIAKGIDFKGNTGNAIHKNLGATLEIVGEGTAPTTTATGNIATKDNAGKLEIGLAKDLQNMKSITADNATTGLTLSNGGNPNATANATGKTEVKVTDAGTTFTNEQPAAVGATVTKTTVDINKSGTTTFESFDAAGTKNKVSIDSTTGTITAGKDADKKVTINGSDGTVKTGKTTVSGDNVIVKDGNNYTKVTTDGVVVQDDTNKATVTVAGSTTYKDGAKETIVDTDGTTITNGTNTVTHSALSSVYETKNAAGTTSARGTVDATGATFTDGTNTFSANASGITITPSNVAGKVVSLTNEGLNNGGNRITNVADPTDDTDVTNKKYVDDRTKLRYKADTTVDDAGTDVTDHTINLLDGTLEITGTADKVVTKATKDGKINIDLADAVKKKLDQLDAKNSDGRDGKTGNEANAIASTGLTKEDGLNEKTTTYKVNALRHGEAGSVVYTDKDGNRLVKATDGKYHKAEEVDKDGNVIIPAGTTTVPQGLDNSEVYASLVSPDGTTTGALTPFNNIGSAIANNTALTGTSFLDKLTSASATNSVKNTAVNATDLYSTAKEILAKGLNFVGNDEAVNVHRDLGATLKVQGADNYTRGANDSNTSNIVVKANATTNGDGLNISLAKDLHGITSITNTDGTKDATGTKLEIGNNGLTVTNTQAGTPATTSTMTVGKDGKTTFTNSENPNNAIEINSKEGTITAGTADDKKVTINGKDGKITTGHTVVNGSSVTITDDNNNKTETTATGTTVTDGNNNKTVTAATGVTVTDGTNTATYTATTSKISDGANKSVETTASGTTITNGNVTTTATAGNTEYKDGNNVTTVNTNGMTVKDGTSTATHTAGSTMFEDADKSAIYSSSGSTIVDDTSSATHTATGSTFTEGNNTASHTATGSSYDDGTNHFELGATGIRINSDNGGSVSINSSGLNNGGNTITHVGDGVADTDAVNVKQLKANKVSLTVNDNNAATTNHNLVLTPSTDAKDKHTNYDVKLADTVTLGTAANAVTVDGTNGTIKAGKDANAVTVDGTKASITAGKDGNAVTVDGTKAKIAAGTGTNAVTTDGTKALFTVGGDETTTNANKVTVDGTNATITAGTTADKAVTIDGANGKITTGKTEVTGSAVTIKDAANDDKKTTVDATGTTVTDGVANGKKVVTTAESVTVVDGTTKTTTKAGETKYEANGKDLTVKTEGITVTDGNNKGSINAMNSTFTNATNGTQVGATLIRVNGDNNAGAITNGISIGKQSVTTTDIGEAPNTTTKTETGNFITGLDNTKWDPKVNGIVSGRAATEDQLKVVDDKVNKGRVFTADTKDANDKVVEAMVGLGETLSIVGGAKMNELTDNNIGVELKAAETKDGVTTPTTMTVKLAKHVNMGDGSTTYTKDVTDKAGKKVGVRTGVMDGESMKYTLYNVDAAGNIITDAKGNKDVNVSTTVTSGGIVIKPQGVMSTKTVELSHEGLNNGGHRITNVADGVAMDDAATVGQLKRSTTTIINHANTIGAHAAALAAMNPLSFDPMRKSQIMAGIGSYRGKQALALGVAHYTSENFMFNVGISMGENEHMMNAGMTYRFGGNTSMIPERYKGGPLSSVYVMQDEIAAFKEENARQKEQLKELPELKQEVAELRAMVQQLLATQGK